MQTPEIYWVIGDATNAGKTTIATALLRVLNREGIPAVAFKPFGGSLLRDLVDLMLARYPDTRCGMFGDDALRLTEASSLTGPDHIDIVSPVQCVYHPNWRSPLLMRTGSAKLGNLTLAHDARRETLLRRADISALLRRARLAGSKPQHFPDVRFAGLPGYAGDAVQRAFAHLAELAPGAIVCEGAAGFTPAWAGGPGPNHVLLVEGGKVHLQTRVDLPGDTEAMAPVRVVARRLETLGRRVSTPIPVVETSRRNQAAEWTVRRLFDKAGHRLAPAP